MENSRRKSTSSESELSDGWNLVDTVEVLPTETSDAESVEVLCDESACSSAEELSIPGDENKPNDMKEEVIPAEGRPTEMGVFSCLPRPHLIDLKAVFEAAMVFIVVAALAVAISFAILIVEEGITSLKSAVFDPIYPTGLQQHTNADKKELLKILADLKSFKLENQRLVEEIENIHKTWSPGENGQLVNALAGNSGSEKTLIASSNPTSESQQLETSMKTPDVITKYVSFISDVVGEQKETQERNLPQNNKALGDMKTVLNYILLGSGKLIQENGTLTSLDSIERDVLILSDVDGAPEFGNFTRKWNLKLPKFIDDLQSEMYVMINKIFRHLNKRTFELHNSFLKKFCKTNTKIINNGGKRSFKFSNPKQEEICKEVLKDYVKKWEEDDLNKYNNKHGKKHWQNKGNERFDEKKKQFKMKKEDQFDSNSKEFQESKIRSEGVHFRVKNKNDEFNNNKNYRETHQKHHYTVEEKYKVRRHSELAESDDKKLPESKGRKVHDENGKKYSESLKINNIGASDKKQYKEEKYEYPRDPDKSKLYRETKYEKKLNGPSNVPFQSEFRGKQYDANKYDTRQGKYLRNTVNDQKESPRINQNKPFKKPSNEKSFITEDVNQYKDSKFSEKGHKSYEFKKSKIDPNNFKYCEVESCTQEAEPEIVPLSETENENFYKKKARMINKGYREGNGGRERRSIKIIGKSNGNLTESDWFVKMSQVRATLRAQGRKSDWVFDRARGRLRNRGENQWVFERALLRERCRENPKLEMCIDNKPEIFFSNSYNTYR